VHYRSFQIDSDIFCRDPDCLDSTQSRPFVPAKIRLDSAFKVVGQSIDFDRDRCRVAIKVENKGSTWMLFSKPQAFWARLKNPPQPDLGWAHPFAKFAGTSD
jgi:hypothetical protein